MDGIELTASQGSEPPCPVSAVILLLVQYAPELTVTQVATSSVSDNQLTVNQQWRNLLINKYSVPNRTDKLQVLEKGFF